MPTPQSQLLLRNAELFEHGHWLVVNANDNTLFTDIGNVQISGFFQYFDEYQRVNQNDKQQFGAFYQGDESLDGVVVYMPKSKEQAQMLLANIAPYLKKQAHILLVGENKSGIKSSPKLLAPHSNTAIKIDSARHCSLYAGCLTQAAPPFSINDWLSQVNITINGQTLTLCSMPGVFNHKQLDPATELLLNQITQVPDGRILDFGCGTGVIGCFLATLNTHTQVTMVDVSAIALYCAQQSARLNGINADLVASNGVKALSGLFNGVYTNPPFHTGIKTDYSVTENFLNELPAFLHPGAELNLVANGFLPYPPLLKKAFGHTQTIASTSKFKVYRCCKT